MENLNDIFNDENNEQAADGSLCIDIVNQSNTQSGKFFVFPENTLREVFETCKNDLGIINSQAVYEYNGKTFSDDTLTVEEIGMEDGGKLLINPHGTVA